MKVFLDTMIYLHYHSIEELDLHSLLGTNSITIVIPRITLRQLDEQKNTHKSRKVRDRVGRILKKIEQWELGGASPRPGVSVEFFPAAPTANYEQHGLNPDWSDDVLIASILEYINRHCGEQILLITQDSGPRRTALEQGIPVKELPEEMKLPEELDPTEVENRELRKRLDKLQNALPELLLCFAGSDDPKVDAHYCLPSPPDTMEDEIWHKIDGLRREYRKQHPPEVYLDGLGVSLTAGMLGIVDTIPPEEYDRYNRELDEYFAAYEKYMREPWQIEAALRRTIRFQIEIRNVGSAPAEDVDVRLDFPDGFTLIAARDLTTEDEPRDSREEPRPPLEPRSLMQTLAYGVHPLPNITPLSPVFPHFDVPISLSNSFNIERTGSYKVEDHFERIKHGQAVQLPEMFLTFDSYESASCFHCVYALRPANLPDPKEGKLHFVIEKWDASEAGESAPTIDELPIRSHW